MIRFLCPHCSYKVTAGNSLAGKPGKCPLCEKDLVIPNEPRGEPAPPPPLPKEDMSLAEPVDALPADDVPTPVHPPNTDDRCTDRPGARRPDAEDDFGDRSRSRAHADDDYDNRVGRRPRRSGMYADCPNCRAPGDATKVSFTWWGGMLGPAIINCVRCRQCGTQYNGAHGDYNGVRILIYQLVAGGLVVGGCCLLANVLNVFSAGVLQGLGGNGAKSAVPATSPLKGGKR